MKNLFVLIAWIAAVSLSSCSNTETKHEVSKPAPEAEIVIPQPKMVMDTLSLKQADDYSKAFSEMQKELDSIQEMLPHNHDEMTSVFSGYSDNIRYKVGIHPCLSYVQTGDSLKGERVVISLLGFERPFFSHYKGDGKTPAGFVKELRELLHDYKDHVAMYQSTE